MASRREWIKDPTASLDWVWDLKALTHQTGKSDWLANGETITEFSIDVPAGLTLDSSSETDGAITMQLSGGTHKTDYKVACTITTSEGRTDKRSILMRVRNR